MSWQLKAEANIPAPLIPAYDLVTPARYDSSGGRRFMTVYIVLGVFIAANLAVIAGVLMTQRGMTDLRAMNREGERRRQPRA